MSRNFHRLFALFKLHQHMTRLLYKNSDFKVFLRIIKNSYAVNNVNACKACGVLKNLVKSLADWN